MEVFRICSLVMSCFVQDKEICFDNQHVAVQDARGEIELYAIYVPTNHVYVGDIFLLQGEDIIRPNLSVREGLGTPISSFRNFFQKLGLNKMSVVQ